MRDIILSMEIKSFSFERKKNRLNSCTIETYGGNKYIKSQNKKWIIGINLGKNK